MSKAASISVPSELIKEVNKELYSFIWRGKDKVKRSALINDIEDGGLKMLDLEAMISAQRIMCLKKYIEDYERTWKNVLDSSHGGGKSFVQPFFYNQGLLKLVTLFLRIASF